MAVVLLIFQNAEFLPNLYRMRVWQSKCAYVYVNPEITFFRGSRGKMNVIVETNQ